MIIESHFLPCLDYFISAINSERIILDIGEHYQKQTYRNRAYFMGPNNILLYTVPVKYSYLNKVLTKDIKIDYNQSWIGIFLKSIRSSYGKSPYFEHFFPYLERILQKQQIYLWELNTNLLTLCLDFIDYNKQLIINEMKIDVAINNNKDLRNCINPKKNHYNKDILAHLTYKQTFGKEFVNNLSILDLIFCEGNHSKMLLISALKKAQSV